MPVYITKMEEETMLLCDKLVSHYARTTQIGRDNSSTTLQFDIANSAKTMQDGHDNVSCVSSWFRK
jgi:hypothetical protein